MTPGRGAAFLLNLISVRRGTTIKHSRPFVRVPWLQARCAAKTKPTYSTCVYRKSDSAILVMKAAKDRSRCGDAHVLNRPMKRGILVQRAVNSRLIIISGIVAKDPAQVRLSKYDHVVETFPSDRADQSLHVPICHGEPGAMGLSRIPMARNRRVTAAP